MSKVKWTVDAGHSMLEFSVKHMMISRVKGVFNDFEANILADPQDLTDAEIEFTVDLGSIDTRKKDRDDHLRSADFFDVENHPQMNFKATDIQKTSENEYDVTGDMTIRGTTKPVTFNMTFEGQHKDPWGNEVAGFSGHGKLNRKEFGLTWNATLETGGVLVGEDININIEIEAHKQS
ncbi:YceI family protein [Ornithinibacillus gellani]|uniref:YceI family protein n=1 Tax=Ornithinibacillus gellani TaxID=2293253 RepID=UPI000F4A51D7|nr:YceI family protein [Ornithinibacillus gellani]TQS75751.1 YceI family protein [Ornithinibacillus gellani]